MQFTEEGLDFLSLNRAMNSREWFHAHREEYERLIVQPLADFTMELSGTLMEIDSALICIPKVGKSISRIWRDTRRGPGLPIYRDVMWLSFLREKYVGLPSLWFELSPRAVRWGCGWYQTPPEVSETIRELILANDKAWRAAKRAVKHSRFELEDTKYKRSRYPDAAKFEREWLDQKSYCITYNAPDIDVLFAPELAERVAGDFRAIAPVYDFFVKATILSRTKV